MTDYILSKQNARVICQLLEQFGGNLTSKEAQLALSCIHLMPRDAVNDESISISELGSAGADTVTLRLNPCNDCDQELLACAHTLQAALDSDNINFQAFAGNFAQADNSFSPFVVNAILGTVTATEDITVTNGHDKIEFSNIVVTGDNVNFDYFYTRTVENLVLECLGNITVDTNLGAAPSNVTDLNERRVLRYKGNIFAYNVTGGGLTFVPDNSSTNYWDNATINRAAVATSDLGRVSFRIVLENKTCC